MPLDMANLGHCIPSRLWVGSYFRFTIGAVTEQQESLADARIGAGCLNGNCHPAEAVRHALGRDAASHREAEPKVEADAKSGS